MARRALPTFLVVAAVALVTGASASAAPTWLAPKDLSAPGGDALDTQVAVDAQGDSFAVWRRFDGSHQIVQGAVRSAGGDWSRPQNLSALGFDSFKQHVDVDPDGNAVAVWYRVIGSNSQIESATLPAGSTTWGAAQPLSDATHFASDPSVAVGPRGDALAVWAEPNGTHTIIEASRRPAGSTTWSPQMDASPTSVDARDARVAVDPLGSAVAVFQIQGAQEVIEAATLPSIASSWTTAKDLSDISKNGFEPDVALDTSGNATAVWSLDTGTSEHVEGATLAAGASTWGAALPISADATNTNRQHIVIDGAGNAYVSWRLSGTTSNVVQASVRPPGGSFSSPQTLSKPGHDAFRPDVAVDARGDAVVAWEQTTATSQLVDAAARPAGATSWGAGTDVSADGQDAHDPRVGVDAAGDATTIWNRSDGSNQIAEAAGYDASGPQLRSLAVPASGEAFAPIGFSVAPVDVWSPVAGVIWSFGDGSAPASGGSVSHTFGAAGGFQVGVAASDSLGNSSSAQRPIAVALPVPTLGAVGQSARVWREGTSLPSFSRARKVPRGTAFRFTLNEPAKVSFVFQRLVTGRKAGRRCVALTPRNRSRRRCTRKLVAGRLSHAYQAGSHRLRFKGRLSRHRKLKLGRYTVVITATSASGQKSAAKRLSFRIVAR
jgi:PKD domain